MAEVQGSAAIGVAIGPDGGSGKFSTKNAAGWSLYLWLGAIAFIMLVTMGGSKR